jgi:hypothetical protein
MRKCFFLVTLLFVGLLLACSQHTTAPDSVDHAVVASDEIPSEVRQALNELVPEDSELLIRLDAELDPNAPSLTDTSFDVYAVTYLWGTFIPMGHPAALDWSGETGVDNQALRLADVIDFEAGEDSILPTLTPATIRWASFTDRDLDGISFLIFMRRNTIVSAVPILRLRTAPLTVEIPVPRLADLNVFYRVDHHNGLAIHAHKIKPRPCPRGFLRGIWDFADSTRTEGTFDGLWLDHADQPIGHLRGEFWTDTSDVAELAHPHQMRGEVTDLLTGAVIAELKGLWRIGGPHICLACGIGGFGGRFDYVDHDDYGSFRGFIGDPGVITPDLRVPFRGAWRNECDHIASDFASIGPE